MKSDEFEYDVFLSYSSKDGETAKHLHQKLSASGLHIFWADSTLKESLGKSWFDAIEDSIPKSRHCVVLFSQNALESDWVKREYRAFHNHCYDPKNNRLLVIILDHGFPVAKLPLFLRDLQIENIENPDALKTVIKALGGTETAILQEQIEAQKLEIDRLNRILGERHTSTLEGKKADQLVAGSVWTGTLDQQSKFFSIVMMVEGKSRNYFRGEIELDFRDGRIGTLVFDGLIHGGNHLSWVTRELRPPVTAPGLYVGELNDNVISGVWRVPGWQQEGQFELTLRDAN